VAQCLPEDAAEQTGLEMGLLRRETRVWIRDEHLPGKPRKLTGKKQAYMRVPASEGYHHYFENAFIQKEHDLIPFLLGWCRGRRYWIFQGAVYSTQAQLQPLEIKALVQESENKVKATVARAVALAEQVRAIEQGGREPISDDVKIFVWQRDKGRCVKCGSNKNLEFDHIIPVKMGGSNTARNIQLLCEACNRAKGGSLV
jgi:hypothetical protein